MAKSKKKEQPNKSGLEVIGVIAVVAVIYALVVGLGALAAKVSERDESPYCFYEHDTGYQSNSGDRVLKRVFLDCP